jgi:hypothetical protein
MMAIKVPYKRLWQKGDAYASGPIAVSDITPFTLGADTIDEHGDEIYNTQPKDMAVRAENLKAKTGGVGPDYPLKIYPPADFMAFFRWARANHVTVLATFPNTLYKPQYDGSLVTESIQEIKDFYASQNIPVLGSAREAMLPESDFYDGIYHLTHAAAIERTERLLPYLKPYLIR